jgi:hypothetical protein
VSALPKPEGSLAASDLPELVQTLYACRATGQLTLTHGGVGKSVVLEGGRLVFASSSSTDDRLGELLLRRGHITLRQLVDAGRAVVPGKRLGAILVEQGVLAPKDLVRAVIDHTQEVIYSLFAWTEGRYRFQAGPEASKESITLKMSTPDIIMEGIRRIESWGRIERATGGIEARYERAEGVEAAVAEMNLSAEQIALLYGWQGVQTVGEIVSASRLSDFDCCRCLWAYRVIGAVRRIDRPAQTAGVEVDADGLGSLLAAEPHRGRP